MNTEISAAMAPFGTALLDWFGGRRDIPLLVRRDDGLEVPMPVGHFFRAPAEFSALERLALEQCRGRVLDIGAGTGGHSLALQERGLAVEAVDVSPEAAEIMVRRGVRQVRCADVLSVQGRRFDTLLLLGHGVGMTGDLAGLDRFLRHARALLLPGGQLLLDSLDVTRDASHGGYHDANRRAGRYVGQVRMQFEYLGRAGPFCSWLHVDSSTLAEHARAARLGCEVLLEADGGEYLARLGT